MSDNILDIMQKGNKMEPMDQLRTLNRLFKCGITREELDRMEDGTMETVDYGSFAFTKNKARQT